MSNRPQQAIILAAGAGRRLGLDGPKSMADVGGRTIIRRQIDAFHAVGVERFIVVVGYEQQCLREHLAGSPGTFTFIENPRYAETNTIYSLYLARHEMAEPFFYANADVVFDRRLPQRLIDSDVPNALGVQTGRCAEEEVKVIVEGDRVAQIGKKLHPADCLGEFVGVAGFGDAILPAFRTTLERLVEHDDIVNDYFERALDAMCATEVLTPVDITDLPCREIDFPEDLEKARNDLATKLVS